MPRNSFLICNAVAAIASSLVTVFGAYAMTSAVLGQLSARRSVVALALAVAAAAAAGLAIHRRRVRSPTVEGRRGMTQQRVSGGESRGR
jgi:membrane protein DedA with SNARE-associated domain